MIYCPALPSRQETNSMEVEKILRTVANETKNFYYQPNLRHVDDYELEDFAKNYGIRTQHGSLAFTSNVKDPSLPLTVYVGSKKDIVLKNLNPSQERILKNLSSTLTKVHHYAKKVPFMSIEKRMCSGEDFNFHCTLFTSLHKKESVRLLFLWSRSLFSPIKRRTLKLHTLCIPEWPAQQRQIIVFPEIGITYILGSDCFDDIRTSFLRMAMYFAKTKGILAFYGGFKLVTCFDDKGKKFKNYGMLFIGPPQTGKTTLLADNLMLSEKGGEVKIFQDDVIFVKKYDQVLGSERIFCVKTKGLESDLQPLLWRAALSRKTNFENVVIDHQGRLDFQDLTLTENGRALIQIQDLWQQQTAEDINLPPMEELDGIKMFLMTKLNTVLPPVCKLEPNQAAALFTLGESVADGSSANTIIRTPASNPYSIGSADEEAEGVLDFIENNKEKIEIYLLNTGSVGKSVNKESKTGKKKKSKPKKIEIHDLALICRAILKRNIRWEKSKYWQVFVPKAIENVNMEKYKLENFYTPGKIKETISGLRKERQKYLKAFPRLPARIKKAAI